jgi:Mn2+/Fe2+ NRAMP family transporter
LILMLSSSQKVMGEFKNGWVTKVAGFVITFVMSATALATLYFFFVGD